MIADSLGDIDPNTSPMVRQPTGRLMPSAPGADIQTNAKLAATSDSIKSPFELEPPTAKAVSEKHRVQPEANGPAPNGIETNRADVSPAARTDSNEPIKRNEHSELVDQAEQLGPAEQESGPARSSSRGSRGSRSRREKSYREPSWNEIGVDGLPIRDADDSAADELENEVAGTRFRDVFGLFTALAFSLLLSQVSLWWLVGIDPLGLGPVVSNWAPSIVPGDFSK